MSNGNGSVHVTSFGFQDRHLSIGMCMLLPSIKMQKTFQLAYRTSSMLHHACIFQCLKGQPSLLSSRQKIASVPLRIRHQHLHASAGLLVSNERELLGKRSSQAGDSLNKELKREIPTTSTDNVPHGDHAQPNSVEPDPLQDKSISLVQRFKKTFKQYGKVLIPVHLVTSTLWFGTFYYAALKGVNVVPFLEFIGLPESITNILKNSQSGNALTAYAMYKIATPARYTVTLGGTSITVKYLRRYGYMSTPPPVKDYIQDRMEETKERLSGKMEETRDRISGKMEETKGRLTEKMEETKDRINEKIQETKGKVSFIKKKE